MDLSERQQNLIAELARVTATFLRQCLRDGTSTPRSSWRLAEEVISYLDRHEVTPQELGEVYDRMHREGANAPPPGRRRVPHPLPPPIMKTREQILKETPGATIGEDGYIHLPADGPLPILHHGGVRCERCGGYGGVEFPGGMTDRCPECLGSGYNMMEV